MKQIMLIKLIIRDIKKELDSKLGIQASNTRM